ncbi:MAG: epoxide hydrolase N-terminal domain-containing protein, partial [Acidimicrobiia bacterium]
MFQLDVADELLDDLRQRLSRTRWPDEIPGSGWLYGSDPAYMRDLVEYWRDDFD